MSAVYIGSVAALWTKKGMSGWASTFPLNWGMVSQEMPTVPSALSWMGCSPVQRSPGPPC